MELNPKMEELTEINFIAAMEGQEAERAMAKIVSFMPEMSKLNVQMRTQYKDNLKKCFSFLAGIHQV